MDINARLERLERENRMMKRGAMAVGAVVFAVATVGAVSDKIPEVIETRMLQVIDENEMVRVSIGPRGTVYFDENGTVRAGVIADTGIEYYDEDGNQRAEIGADSIAYFDENGTARALMDIGGFCYDDKDGNHRAHLGVAELLTPATGAETRYPAAVVVFDDDGDVIWQAP